MRGIYTIILLVFSNLFMTLAWYGHLKFKEMEWSKNLGLLSIILISWGLAFFEYLLQVPANKYGFKNNGGEFNLVQLKTIQEVTSLVIFILMTLFFFRTEKLSWNHFVAFGFIVLAVFFVFKKW